MKRSVYILTACSVFLLAACNKYAGFNGNIKLSGYAYIDDTMTSALPVPLDSRALYLSVGSDTSSYQYQLKTDAAGSFSVPSLKQHETYTLFTRFINNNTEYRGVVAIKTGNNDHVTAVLKVYPIYINGLSLLFTDIAGGAVPRISFRLYTSRVLAAVDSVKYAYIDSSSDINGEYNKIGMPARLYYIVSNDSAASLGLRVFDSVRVSATGLTKKTVIAK